MVLSTSMFVAFVLVGGFLIWGILRFAEFAWHEVRRHGMTRLVWWDGDAGMVRVELRRVRNGEFTTGKGDDAKRYILQGGARCGGEYPTWFLHPRHGWNYRAPTDAETVDRDLAMAALSVFNPESYAKATARNEWADSLEANDEADRWGWVQPVALVAGVAVVAMLGLLGFIAYRISGAGA